MSAWTSPTLSTSVRETVLMLGIELTLVVAIGYAINCWCRRAELRRWVWCGIIVTMGMLSLAELTGLTRLSPTSWLAGGELTEPDVMGTTRPSSAVPAARFRTGGAGIRQPISPAAEPIPWAKWIVVTWAGGTVVLFTILVSAHGLLWRLRRRLQPVDDATMVIRLAQHTRASPRIRVGTCRSVISPFVFGLCRPTMAMPAHYPKELRAAHREAIIVHELTHLRNRDPWWQLGVDLLAAFLWWHPGVWLTRTMFRRSAEHAADAATTVLPDGPMLLAESLVALSRRQLRHSWCAGLAVSGRTSTWLRQRVLTLLELKPPHPQRPTRWEWRRHLLAASAIIMVMIGTASARSAAQTEGTNMQWIQVWRQSLVGLAVLAAFPDPAPAQIIAGPVGKAGASGLVSVGAAGKSEEGAMQAIGLNDEQRRQFNAAKEGLRDATNKVMIQKSGSDRVVEGKVLNTKWREDLRKILTPEQYSRYTEYWQTNKITMKRSEPGADGKASYTIKISAHPLEADAKLTGGLQLSGDQAAVLARLKESLTKEMSEIQESVQSPAKLPEATKQLAALQRRRNEALQEILSDEQYGQYRKALDALVEADVAASGGIRVKMAEKK